jgi:hypothetical protein
MYVVIPLPPRVREKSAASVVTLATASATVAMKPARFIHASTSFEFAEAVATHTPEQNWGWKLRFGGADPL